MPDVQQIIRDLEIPGYGDDEVGFFERAVQLIEPVFIAEWGTNVGSSARIFYEITQVYDFGTEIFTVDLPIQIAALDRDHAGMRTGWQSTGLPRVTHLYGDGVTEALSAYALCEMPRQALFFIDGNHQWENVYRELAALHHFAPRAVLLLHDTNSAPGEAADQFLDDHPGSYQVAKLASQAGMMRLWPNG